MQYSGFQRFTFCKLLILAGLAIFAILFNYPGFADQILVPGNYSTIQGAIDVANNGDEIIVSQGTYKENIKIKGKNITLRSTNPTDPTVVKNTIIDGNSKGTVVSFSGDETSECVLSGFYISNSGSETTYGGGINGHGAKPTIINNQLYSNRLSTVNLSNGGGYTIVMD